MKKKIFLLIAAYMVTIPTAIAYSFSAVAPSGQTLYYNISNGGAIVTYPGTSANNPYMGYIEPTGALVIPDTVVFNGINYAVFSIGTSAFRGCSYLTSVSIPNTITSIGDWVFAGCANLTSVSIPNTVTSIGGYAFQYCTGLTSISIPNSVTSIGWAAFEACTSLTSVSIPNSINCIDGFVFTVCTGLISVSIPNSVTLINRGAFRGCTNLISVSIPNSVTSIKDSAFRGCSSLTSVYCNSINPPSISSYVFDGSYCNIYVPCGSVNSYMNAAGWSRYSSRIQGAPNLDFAYDFSSNNDTMGTVSSGLPDCDSNIIVTALVNSGYQFNGWSDGGIGNPRTFHLTGDTNVAALFDFITYSVVGQTSDAVRGTVTGSATVHYGDTVVLTAIPNYGYHFTYWNDSSTVTSREVVATDDVSYTAYFEPNNYIVTVLSDNITQGFVEGSGSTAYLGSHSISATPYTGYYFSHWSDGNTDNPRTLTVTQDTSLVAYFVPATIPSVEDSLFTVVANNAMGGGVYPSGSTAVVFALPQVDLLFAGWSDNETANPRYVVVTSDTTLTALFRAPDTVRVYDTVINIVFDTTEYNHYFYDTTHVYDTLVVLDTTRIYDTVVYVNVDTLNHYFYDTTTVYNTVINIVYDTTKYNHYIYDSIHVYDTLVMYDTTRIFDTMVYVNIDTLYHYYYDTIRVFDTLVISNTMHHYFFDSTMVYDTTSITHYVFDTTRIFDSVWVFDSVYVTDTLFLYFFDTVYIPVPVEGVDGVETVNVKVYTHSTQIIVEGAQGMVVRLYDINGRLLATKVEDTDPIYIYVQTSGTYLVRIGDLPARRVVVIR